MNAQGFEAEFQDESRHEWAVGEADSFPTSFPYNLP